jgi:RNA polymerase sigma factor (sigma-70 family)
MQRILGAIARSDRERACDIADLQQAVFFSLLEAIEQHRKRASQFRSFAGCIAFRDYQNAQRDESRRAYHFEHSVRAQQVLDGTTMEGIWLSGRRSLDGFGVADPAQLAEEGEQQTRFEKTLAGYPGEDRFIIDGFRQNLTLGQVAKRLHVSAKTIARRFRQMMCQMAVYLDAPQMRLLHWRGQGRKKRTPAHADTIGNETTLNASGTLTTESASAPALEKCHVSTVSARSCVG